MEKLFQELLGMSGVLGLVLLSREGKVLFESKSAVEFAPARISQSWKMIVDTIEEYQELDLVFEQGRLFIRKTETGYLFVALTKDESISLVKLNCDIAISNVNKMGVSKGLKRFFKL